MRKKYIYKNDGSVVEWTQAEAEVLELQNRELPENQRHDLDFETDSPNNYKWSAGHVIEKPYNEKLLGGLVDRKDAENLIKQNIYTYFEQLTEEGVEFQGNTYQADEISCNRINNAILLLETSGSGNVNWVDRDNNIHSFDLNGLKNLGLAIGSYWSLCFAKRTQLRDELPSKTLQELVDYNVESEWKK